MWSCGCRLACFPGTQTDPPRHRCTQTNTDLSVFFCVLLWPLFCVLLRLEFRRSAQFRELLLVELTPMPDRDLFVGDQPDAHAAEAGDGVADRLEHAPDLALPPFVQHNLHERLLGP